MWGGGGYGGSGEVGGSGDHSDGGGSSRDGDSNIGGKWSNHKIIGYNNNDPITKLFLWF